MSRLADYFFAIFDMHRAENYPTWICFECGDKYGKGMPCNHVCTVHDGVCDICGKDAAVTEPRDFGHLRPGWENHK